MADQMWCGIFKINEEVGELQQVLGKLGAFPTGDHPDGGPALLERLEDEVADVMATLIYFRQVNALNEYKIDARVQKKLARFYEWGLSGVPIP